MWVLLRWFAGLLVKDLLFEHAGEILAAIAFTVVLVFATITWALAVIAQPAGIYWLASQAPVELQAQHPVLPIVGAPGAVAAPTAMPLPTVAPGAVSDRVQFMLAQARTWLGVPYMWSGCTRGGVDCSCLVMNALATIGISAPRTTVTQWPWVRHEPRSELRPGDLVFFNDTCRDCGPNPSHVGMYVGNGQIIDAGDPVQINTIESGFYLAHYAGAGRPPGL